MQHLLVTGGAGFIGSNFIHFLNKVRSNWKITVVDKLTYAGNLDNLTSAKAIFIKEDINNFTIHNLQSNNFPITGIINLAAETHVDNSINNSKPFADTNVLGTLNLLEFARKNNITRFLQVSTDEVYGSIEKGSFTELSNILPNSPYAASKASADMIVRAYHKTYGLDTIITRCSNNYGPRQHSEKFIPTIIQKAIRNKKIPIYGHGNNVRDWIHVEDHCQALLLAYENGKSGEVYNIGSKNEWKNIEVAKLLLNKLKKSNSLISYVDDRLEHDLRYSIDSEKIKKELGFVPLRSFSEGIDSTLEWYLKYRA